MDEFGLAEGQPSGEELGRILWTRQHGGDDYGWDQARADGSWRTWAQQAAQYWNAGTFGNGGDQIPISGTSQRPNQPPPPQNAPPPSSPPPSSAPPAGNFGLGPGQPSGQELGKILWTRQHGGNPYGWEQAVADGSWTTWATAAAQLWNQGKFGNGGDQIPISGTPYNGALSPGVTSPGAPGTTINVGNDNTSAYRVGGGPGSGTVDTKFGQVTGEFGLPGNMGVEWWKTFGAFMNDLTDDTGTVYDPRTGQPITQNGQLQQTLKAIAQQASIRQADTALQQSQQRLDDARRAGDLDREQQELQYQRTLQLDRDRLGENARQFDQQLGFNVGEALGRIGGQNTLSRDTFEEQRSAAAYQRAANPALSFENELARGYGGTAWNPQTGQAPGGQTPATVAPVTTPPVASVVGAAMPQGENAWYQGPRQPGMMYTLSDPGQSAQLQSQPQSAQPQVRTPAFLNVLRSGGYTPTVGGINAPSTTGPANQAALGEDFFRLQNRRAEPRLTSVQRLIRSSFGRAGGVSDEQQSDLLNLGMPRERSLTPTYSGR